MALAATAVLAAGAGLVAWRAWDGEPARSAPPTAAQLRVAMQGTSDGVADTLETWSEPLLRAGLELERALSGRPPTAAAVSPAAQRLERAAARALAAMRRQPPVDDYDAVKLRAEDAFEQYGSAARLAVRALDARRNDGPRGFASLVEGSLLTVRGARAALADALARLSPGYGTELLDARQATRR